MNNLGYKFLLLVLVTFCYNLDRICAQNATKMLSIPKIGTNVLGPKQFERIIVPYYPPIPIKEIEKERIIVPYYPPIPRKEIPVTEKVEDIENTTEEVKTSSKKPQNCNDGKKSDTKSYSYVTRSDGFSKKPPPKKYSPVSKPKQSPKVTQPKQTPKVSESNESKLKESNESKSNESKDWKLKDSNELKSKESNESKDSKDLPAEHRTFAEPNEIQPLHINTKGFKKSQPDHKKMSPEEKKKKFNEQEEKLKMESLPENPEKVPKTDWFDNHGKYNYGIIHHSHPVEETASVEDTMENESKEVPKGVHNVVENPQKIQNPQAVHNLQPAVTVHHPQPAVTIYHPPPTVANINHHPLTFKSIFNDPNSHSKVHQQNGNNGNFLYKSEVYYPNYRDHIYLPFTTYYGDANIFPKHLPVFNSHTVYHNPQAVPQHNVINQNSNKAHGLPIKVPLPIPKVPTSSPTPPKTVYPVVHKNEPPAQKHPLPTKKPVEKKPPPPPSKNHQNEEEYDEDEEIEDDGGKAEYYDYEEGDSVEDDEGSKDKVQGESSEDYEEESDDEEEEEKPTYKYTRYNNARDDEKSSEDEFDRAWQKYGYSPKGTSEENESSESRLVPQEIEPERKKIVHMKMEYYTAPHDGNDVYDSKIRRSIDVSNKSSHEMNSKMSGSINNSEKDKNKKKKRKNKKSGAKSQQQHPNAGPDDLKFFQYINYLGNGEHRAGGRVGNDKHYIEQHERGSKVAGSFQKKVKWADKDGGFGEHFWDLNHGR